MNNEYVLPSCYLAHARKMAGVKNFSKSIGTLKMPTINTGIKPIKPPKMDIKITSKIKPPDTMKMPKSVFDDNSLMKMITPTGMGGIK